MNPYISLMKNFVFDRNTTNCHLLWDSVYINQYGEVFSCCFNEPNQIGNIYKKNLYKIWSKNFRLQIYRKLSLHRCLSCSLSCYLITRANKQKTHTIPSSYPKRVWILYGELCNINCIMCWQDSRSKKMLNNEAIMDNIDWSKVEEIVLQGGEILAMSSAKELFLTLAREKNKKVNIITNGLLLNDVWMEHILSNSNWIEISFNAATKQTHETVNRGSNSRKVVNNIKRLAKLKEQYKSDIEIIFKYTVVPENITEIPDAIKFAETLGCNRIVYGYSKKALAMLDNDVYLRNRLKERLNYVISNNDIKIKIEKDRLYHTGLIDNVSYQESYIKPLSY